MRPATLLKRETLSQVFSCEFCGIPKNTFFHRTPLMAAFALIRNEKPNKWFPLCVFCRVLFSGKPPGSDLRNLRIPRNANKIFTAPFSQVKCYWTEADLGLQQHPRWSALWAVNYYHKALHLGCCSSPRSACVESHLYWGRYTHSGSLFHERIY